MPSNTVPWDFYKPGAVGQLIPYDELDWLSQKINDVLIGILETIAGTSGGGFLSSTHFNGSAIAGQLAIQVSAGHAFLGAAGSLLHVYNASPLTLQNGNGSIGEGSIVGSGGGTTNYFFLRKTGVWHVDQDNTAPAESQIAFTAVFNATESTSQNNLPAGRVNLTTVAALLTEIVAARGSLASVDTRLDVILNENGTLKNSTVGTANLSFDVATQAELDAINTALDARLDALESEVTNARGSLGSIDARLDVIHGNDGKLLGPPLGAPGLSQSGAGATITVTAQAKKHNGDNHADRALVRWWISDSQYGAPTGSAPTTVTLGLSAVVIHDITTKVQAVWMTHSDGRASWEITKGSAGTIYLHVECAGFVSVIALVFTS